MVSIDTVYQRVLVLANKEQRGYITPQEFNLYANQAQMDIFEQYFHDMSQFRRINGNDTEHSDSVDIIEEKISLFERTTSVTAMDNKVDISNIQDLYRLGNIYYNSNICEKVSNKNIIAINNSPLLKPLKSRPVYTISGNNIVLYPIDIYYGEVSFDYIKKPSNVRWGYVISSTGNALYNDDINHTKDFELHISEETKLVIKILALAGFTLKDPGLYTAATGEDNRNIQQEKQ